MAESNNSSNLYALIVGINKYDNVRNLKGVNDANAIEEYLNSSIAQAQFGEIKIKKIVDLKEGEKDTGQRPTKVNIIKAFQEHLGQAKEGDTALFFFAGHGVREETDLEVFEKSESDGKIAGIVCAESDLNKQKNPKTNTISDKELRYLIRQVAQHEEEGDKAKVHVVAIFDCCHSGGNTRSVVEEELPASSRQVMKAAAKSRTWEGYFFHEDLNDKVFEGGKQKAGVKIEEILPQGNHVMLAACREVELAWEKGGKGNFTKALIEVLTINNGQISYDELHTRVVNRMRFQYLLNKDGRNDQRQTPQIYVNSPQKSDRYKLFLSNKPNEAPTVGVVEYNKEENEWRLALGALHGVPIPDPRSRQPIKVELFAGKEKKAITEAVVKDVFPSHATLTLPRTFRPDPKVSYSGKVMALGIPPLKIYLGGDEAGVKPAKKHFDKTLKTARPEPFKLVEEITDSDYAVLAEDGAYRIVVAPDNTRHLLEPIKYLDGILAIDDAQEELYHYLSQMSRWRFLKKLERTNIFRKGSASLSNYPIEVRVYQLTPDNEEKPLLPKGNVFTIDTHESNSWLPIRFELINRYNKPLYVGLAMMDHTFGVASDASMGNGLEFFRQINENPFILSKTNNPHGDHIIKSSGGPVDQDGNNYTEKGTPDGIYITNYNWSGYTDYIKLIVSEVDFDLTTLDMDPLPGPDLGTTRNRFSRERTASQTPKWEVQTLEIHVPNPFYLPETQPV
ncbi:MAG: caspase family protein [Bacteroidota bacterium]